MHRREYRHEHIFLVDSGERNEGIDGVEPLLKKKLLLRAVALYDHRLRERVCKLDASFRILLDDLHGYSYVGKHLRKIVRRAASSHYHDVFSLAAKHSDGFQKLLYIRGRCRKPDLVSAFQFKISVGDVHLVAALNGTHKKADLVFIAQLVKLHSVKLGIGTELDLDHFEIAAREVLDLHRRGKLQYVEHILRAEQFGIYRHRKLELLTHKSETSVVILRISDTGDRVLRPHLLCDKAAQHIHFVGTRRGDKKGLAVRAVSANSHDIVYIRYFGYDVRIVVYCDDVLTLCDKAFEDRRAYLSAARNDYFHVFTIASAGSFLSVEARRKLSVPCPAYNDILILIKNSQRILSLCGAIVNSFFKAP